MTWDPTADEIAAAFRDALRVWDALVDLRPPEALSRKEKQDWGGSEPLAYIDLSTRQIVVNFALLDEIGARASLPGVLAHELGHHVRFPHTLGLAAQLMILERRLLPGLGQSLTNLFFDLQVNEVVGRTRQDELVAVYRGFVARDGAKVSPLFWFYLAVYEELWGLIPGAITPAGSEAGMEKQFPAARAEARVFAQTFYALPDVFLQFVYFASVFLRYLPAAGESPGQIPLGGDVPDPDLDDWAGSMYGSPDVERALDEAAKRGWIREGQAGSEPDALDAINRVFPSGAPGTAAKDFRLALVSRHYKRLVDQHLIDIPPEEEALPEPFLPTTTEEWEPGDNPRAIDWTASILASGALAPLRLLRRELEPEPPPEPGQGRIGVEIYLDTSGSMPAPDASLNAMTLAAQVLSASAIRRGGRVRGVVYSWDFVESDWMYDEEVARRFLLQYSGGGTRYPWKALDRLSADKDLIRVVISDGDFLSNLRDKGAAPAFGRGIVASRRFVTMLAGAGEPQVKQAMKEAYTLPQLRVVLVAELARFGKMAADLARALFGG